MSCEVVSCARSGGRSEVRGVRCLGGIYVSPYLGEGAVSLYLTVSESSPVSGIQGLTYMYRLTYMYLLLIALICSNYYI